MSLRYAEAAHSRDARPGRGVAGRRLLWCNKSWNDACSICINHPSKICPCPSHPRAIRRKPGKFALTISPARACRQPMSPVTCCAKIMWEPTGCPSPAHGLAITGATRRPGKPLRAKWSHGKLKAPRPVADHFARRLRRMRFHHSTPRLSIWNAKGCCLPDQAIRSPPGDRAASTRAAWRPKKELTKVILYTI